MINRCFIYFMQVPFQFFLEIVNLNYLAITDALLEINNSMNVQIILKDYTLLFLTVRGTYGSSIFIKTKI